VRRGPSAYAGRRPRAPTRGRSSPILGQPPAGAAGEARLVPQPRNALAIPDGDPRGRRYAAPDRQDAFLAWLSGARRPSAAATVRTGIAENPLRSWAKADDWPGRARAHDDEAAELGKVAVLATVTAELAASVQTIVELRDDPAVPPKTRLEAA